MRIACIGGGPASLYASLLFRQALPETEITVYERNREGDTFGWGVVFSDETLGHFERCDKTTFDAISAAFVHWTDIDTWLRGTWVRSTGHGFSGLGRKRLLAILGARCRELGVRLVFEREVPDPRALMAEADLVLGADGVQSMVRSTFEAAFRPDVRLGRARFTWLGTTLPLTAFTFLFQETEHGLFTVHAYPFEHGLSTFIVECDEATWTKAGMGAADERTTASFLERVFAQHLKGHPLLTNRSIWRRFPTVRCGAWHHENVVLLGDAVHTAHFSIGSGTKLAMEDAIALVDAFKAHGTRDVPGALAAYEANRRRDVERLQRAARVSQAWFEAPARYLAQDPYAFVFNLMTRSQRLTWSNLAKRDPALVQEVGRRYAARHGTPLPPDHAPSAGAAPPPPVPPLLAPLTLRSVTLPNRIVVSPMCQYSAVDGVPQEWHLVHLGSRAVGGAGLVMGEATGVSPGGRITTGCTGLWNDAQEAAWARIVAFVHRESASKVGLQIAHAGRKGSCALPWEGGKALRDASAWTTLGPTDAPFYAGDPAPRAMTQADMDEVREQFVTAARRAARAGFDVLEIHAAHGYLLSSWISSASNTRRDEHGRTLEDRLRYPLEVVSAVRATWPQERPLFVRISASDWLDPPGSSGGRGMTVEDAVAASRAFAAVGVDVIDVSSAGNVPESSVEYGRMYQVPFADQIRHDAHVKVMTVGGVPDADHANTVLAAERADLVAIARGHLLDPYLTLRAAAGARHAAFAWPKQYGPARPF
jgi:anthraniloyl-CoA monooxygenase